MIEIYSYVKFFYFYMILVFYIGFATDAILYLIKNKRITTALKTIIIILLILIPLSVFWPITLILGVDMAIDGEKL